MIELPAEFPNERSQDVVYSGNIGVQLSHEPQFDPAPRTQKLIISSRTSGRTTACARENLGVKPMLGFANLALLAFVLAVVGMVVVKLVPGLLPGL